MDQMNQTPQPPAPQKPMMPETQPPKNGGQGAGPMVAIVVIVLVLALGGLYYFLQTLPQLNQQGASADAQDQQSVEALMSQGSSDTAAAIQADINATDLTPVDKAVSDVDASVSAQ